MQIVRNNKWVKSVICIRFIFGVFSEFRVPIMSSRYPTHKKKTQTFKCLITIIEPNETDVIICVEKLLIRKTEIVSETL